MSALLAQTPTQAPNPLPLPSSLPRRSNPCKSFLFQAVEIGSQYSYHLASAAIGAAILGGAGGAVAALGAYSVYKEFFTPRQIVNDLPQLPSLPKLETNTAPPPSIPTVDQVPASGNDLPTDPAAPFLSLDEALNTLSPPRTPHINRPPLRDTLRERGVEKKPDNNDRMTNLLQPAEETDRLTRDILKYCSPR